MPNTREKLIDIVVHTPCVAVSSRTAAEHIVDNLIANGVTLATDDNVGDKLTPTNADRLRAMTDEELAKTLYNGLDVKYCTDDPACVELLDTEDGIPEEKCIACALRWLRQPAKEA